MFLYGQTGEQSKGVPTLPLNELLCITGESRGRAARSASIQFLRHRNSIICNNQLPLKNWSNSPKYKSTQITSKKTTNMYNKEPHLHSPSIMCSLWLTVSVLELFQRFFAELITVMKAKIWQISRTAHSIHHHYQSHNKTKVYNNKNNKPFGIMYEQAQQPT